VVRASRFYEGLSAPALISRLFDRLPDRGHELVLFDVNRVELVEKLLSKDPAEELAELLTGKSHKFALSVVKNELTDGVPSRRVVVMKREAGTAETSTQVTEMEWPDEVFSLSHIALPCLAVASLPFRRYGACVFDQGRPSRISPTMIEWLVSSLLKRPCQRVG
jgi:hypothetical protein